MHRCKSKETHSNGQVETTYDQTPGSTKNPMEERSTPLSPRMGGQYLDQSVSWGIDFTDVEAEDVGLTQLSNDESKGELSSMSAASHRSTQLETVSWIADNIIPIANMKDKLSVECFGDHHGSGDALKMAIVTDNVVSTDSREFNEEKEILSERSLVDGNDDQSSHELPDSREHSDGIIVDDVRLEKNRPTPVNIETDTLHKMSEAVKPRDYEDSTTSNSKDTDVEVEDEGLTQLSNINASLCKSKDKLYDASHTNSLLESVSWIADERIPMTSVKATVSVEYGDHHHTSDVFKMTIVTDNVVSTDTSEFSEEKEILSDTTFETNERSLVDGNDDQSSHELPDSREHSDGIIVDDVRLEKNRPTPVNIEPSTFHKMSVAVKPRDYEDSSASNSKDTVYSQGNGTHDSSRVKHSVYPKHPESKDRCNSTTESTEYNQPAKKLRIADLRSITQKTLKDSPRQQSLPIRSNSKSVILLDQFHVSGNSSNRNRNARDDSKQNKRGLTNESSHDEQVPRKKGCSSETPSLYRSPRQAQQNENQGVRLREFATTNLSPSISKNGIRPPENNRNKSTKSTGGAQMLKFALSSICKSSSRANNPKPSNL